MSNRSMVALVFISFLLILTWYPFFQLYKICWSVCMQAYLFKFTIIPYTFHLEPSSAAPDPSKASMPPWEGPTGNMPWHFLRSCNRRTIQGEHFAVRDGVGVGDKKWVKLQEKQQQLFTPTPTLKLHMETLAF